MPGSMASSSKFLQVGLPGQILCASGVIPKPVKSLNKAMIDRHRNK